MEAAGLASSVITFIEFSYKIINGTVDVYKKSATGSASDTHIRQIIEDLNHVTSGMTTNLVPLTAEASAGIAQTPAARQAKSHQQALQELAFKCNELSGDLLAILKDLERKADGNKLLRSFEAAWKTLRKDGKIKEIEAKLDSYRVQILLRSSLLLSDKSASIQAQLDRIQQGNTGSFGVTLCQLRSLQEAVNKLDADLQAQASQASHAPVTDPDHVFAMKDMREELLRINQSLKTIPRQAPADLQILTRLRFDHIHARFDAIVDGELDIFTKLLGGNFDPDSDFEKGQDIRAHARKALDSWLEVGDKVLHISGKAGSGKSTLMKLLSQNTQIDGRLRAWAGTRTLVMASFFFWLSSNNALQNSIEGLYRSLLLEVLQQCPELTKIVFPRHWDEISTQGALAPNQTPFRLPELQDAMKKIVEGSAGSHDYCFCFFIDGLDEYAGQSMDHMNLAKQLRLWAQSPDVRICASSRPHQEFHGVFDKSARIHLHELTGPDIRRFVREIMNDEEDNHLSRDQIGELACAVEDRASGVFLWARLVANTLCEGIRHSDRFATLDAKVEQAPGELMDLFLHLFNQISSADRSRAYQLLLLSTSRVSGLVEINALLVSWMDDVEDVDFPYNVPRRAYTDEEVARRIAYAERQLKLTCRGLLEVSRRKKYWGDPIDFYFQHGIGLLHRSARDFIDQPETMSVMEQHLGGRKLTSSDYARLALAEIKFAPTSAQTLRDVDKGGKGLYLRFWRVCRVSRLTPRALEECEGLLQSFRTEPFSATNPPGDVRQNDGTINWGMMESSMRFGRYCLDISYIHLLVRSGASSDFIMGRVASGAYDDSSPDLCLVLSASWAHLHGSDLLRPLLEHGLDFKDDLLLHHVRTRQTQRVPGWVAFLVLLANECPYTDWDTRATAQQFAALELHLCRMRRRSRSADDQSVLFEFHLYADKDAAWMEAGPRWAPVLLTLEDLILCSRPANMDSVLCEMRARKTWGRWADGFAGGILRGATAWTVTGRASSASDEAPSTRVKAAFRSECVGESAGDVRFAVRRIKVGDETYEMQGVPGIRLY